MKILQHNLTAIDKVKKSLCDVNRACVVHATGTGKSFIIAEIAKDYKKVLIVVPNHYIRQQLEQHGINARYILYSGLKNNCFPENSFDLIVLDEFHRAGASLWGENVKKLLGTNPEAKLFGTTATEIRYLDSGRNMAEELFGGNIVSKITIVDAWIEGILPIPTYINSLYSIEKTYEKKKTKIQKAALRDNNKYSEACEVLEKFRLNWENSFGVANVLKKHLPPETKSIIVFCKLGENLPTFEATFRQWMNEAGFSTVHYMVNYRNPNSLADMERFRKEKFGDKTVKVVFSINMLNEGIHVPDVDCVMFFRGTISGNVFLQQLGRCMSVGYTGVPIVFDFMDNISSVDFVANLKRCYDNRKNAAEKHNVKHVEDFVIIDYVRDVKDVVDKLNDILQPVSLDERLSNVKRYIEQNGWPKSRTTEYEFIKRYSWHPEIVALKEKYWKPSPHQNKFSDILPSVTTYIEKYGWPKKGGIYYEFIHSHRKRPEIKALYKKFGRVYRKVRPFEIRLNEIKLYILKYGWPKKGTPEFFFIQHNSKKSEILLLKEQFEHNNLIIAKTKKISIEDITEYLQQYGWPRPYQREYQYLFNHRKEPRINELFERYYPKKTNTS